MPAQRPSVSIETLWTGIQRDEANALDQLVSALKRVAPASWNMETAGPTTSDAVLQLAFGGREGPTRVCVHPSGDSRSWELAGCMQRALRGPAGPAPTIVRDGDARPGLAGRAAIIVKLPEAPTAHCLTQTRALRLRDGLSSYFTRLEPRFGGAQRAPRLTVGMAVHDDFDGAYFSVQALRLGHPEAVEEIELLLVDNSPDSEHGKTLSSFAERVPRLRYVPFDGWKSPAVKHMVFEFAATPHVLCMDSHVLLAPGALAKLLSYLARNPNVTDLLQGPIVHDDLEQVSTHMDPVWNDRMFGTWGVDERGLDPAAPPFEIPMQGMGLFCCRRDAWLGYNRLFEGFGGEEGYIHEKYRKAGRRTLCLPFLRWLHRFDRPHGVRYRLRLDDRIRNYFIGHLELGLDPAEVFDHFLKYEKPERLASIFHDATRAVRAQGIANNPDPGAAGLTPTMEIQA